MERTGNTLLISDGDTPDVSPDAQPHAKHEDIPDITGELARSLDAYRTAQPAGFGAASADIERPLPPTRVRQIASPAAVPRGGETPSEVVTFAVGDQQYVFRPSTDRTPVPSQQSSAPRRQETASASAGLRTEASGRRPTPSSSGERVALGGLVRALLPGAEKRRINEQLSEKVARLQELGREVPSCTIAALAEKGSAKTATMIHLALLAGAYTGRSVVVLDGNPSGRVAERFGLTPEKNLSMRQLAELYAQAERQVDPATDAAIVDVLSRSEGLSPLEVAARIRQITGGPTTPLDVEAIGGRMNPLPEHQGVQFVSMSFNLNGKEAGRAMEGSRQLASYRMVDTGNVVTSPGALELLRRADVLVAPANITTRDSMPMLNQSMARLRNKGPEFEELVDRSVVVVSQLKAGDIVKPFQKGRQRYVHIASKDNGVDLALGIDTHKGAVLSVPFDSKVRTDQDYSLKELHPKTVIAYMDVLIAGLTERKRQLAIKTHTGHNVNNYKRAAS